MEWMIGYDGYRGSCSVYRGTKPYVADQNYSSLVAVRVKECMRVCDCLCVMSRVGMSIYWTAMCMSKCSSHLG